MNTMRALLVWPIIIGLVWYFVSFSIAVITGLVYLHIMVLLLSNTIQKSAELQLRLIQATDKELGSLRDELIRGKAE